MRFLLGVLLLSLTGCLEPPVGCLHHVDSGIMKLPLPEIPIPAEEERDDLIAGPTGPTSPAGDGIGLSGTTGASGCGTFEREEQVRWQMKAVQHLNPSLNRYNPASPR